MEEASPARLFATAVGAALVVYGMAGFFFDSSFATPANLRDALGLLSVNGWANSFHILSGSLGLLLAGVAPRPYALCISTLYATVAVLGSVI